MSQKNFACLAGVGFAFMVIASALVLASLLVNSWAIQSFDDSILGSYYGPSVTYGLWSSCTSASGCISNFSDSEVAAYRKAALAFAIIAVILCFIGLFCLFLFLCGLCCCKQAHWITGLPTANLVLAILGALSIWAACIIFIVGFAVSDGKNDLSSIFTQYYSWLPGVSFFLGIAAGIAMIIGGGVAAGARNIHTTVATAPSNGQTIVISNTSNQQQSFQPQYYPPQPYTPYPNQPRPYQPNPYQPYQPNPYQPNPYQSTATQTTPVDISHY